MHRIPRPGPINGAALNLAMGVFGVSILAMPSAFQGTGIPVAIVVLTIIAALTVTSIHFLSVSMETLALYSYEELSRRLLGPFSERCARWMLFLFNFGDCVSYVLISGHLMQPMHEVLSKLLIGEGGPSPMWPPLIVSIVTSNSAAVWMAVYWICVLFPLSFVRRVTLLQRLSAFAIMALLYIVSAVVYRYYFPLPSGLRIASTVVEAAVPKGEHDDAMLVARIVKGLLSVPIIMFAFDCQALVFQLYTSLDQHSNPANMLKVTTKSIVGAWVVFVVIGTFGYLSFGDGTPDNILRAFNPNKDPIFAVAYALFLIPASVAFALVLFPVRDVIFNMLAPSDSDGAAFYAADDGSPSRTFYAVSALLSVACCLTALVAPQLDVVFGLLGGLCSSCLCFLFPAAYRLRLSYEGLLPITDAATWRVAWGMVVLGVFGAIFGTCAGVLQLMSS